MALLFWIASISLALALISALAIGFDLFFGHKQHMWIMNVVWPVTALWAGPVAVWAYYRYGRLGSDAAFQQAKSRNNPSPTKNLPFPVHVAKGATHCGSGCTLGDVVAEVLVLVAPLSIFGKRLFAAWFYDYIFAFAFGIAFQYFTIKPMRNLDAWSALKQALKADALSLTAWQVGMYGWMAIAVFAIFNHELPKDSPIFWWMIQVAMFAGFATAYPVNWWLLRRGIKEAM